MISIEQLESRCFTSIISFWFEVPEEDIFVGETFTVEVWTKEHHPLKGLRGIALNISWDANSLELVSDPIVTDALPLQWPHEINNEQGTLTNINGFARLSTDEGRIVGQVWPEKVIDLTFRAEAEGTSPIKMRQGGLGIATVPVSSLGRENIDFKFAEITQQHHQQQDWCENVDDYFSCEIQVATAGQPELVQNEN
jgi:hypothetical protein